MAVNLRQSKFAELYVACGNATRAYGQAYDVPKTDEGNYPGWCATDGNRLLRNEKVRAEVERIKGENQALASLSREETLDYLVSAITTPAGEIGPDNPLCEEYEVKPDGSIKVKAISKIAAIKELVRLTGMAAPERTEVSFDAEVTAMLAKMMGAKAES